MTLATTSLPRPIDSFRNPAVRHLAWLCYVPQLLTCPITFEQTRWLPQNLQRTLEQWDKNPENGPSVLTESPHYRLGLYVERLYECLLTDILGWTVVARNLPIRANGVTLGELDFVVHNPHTGDHEHHEIAVKFYLGVPAPLESGARWYGPNARDRLDIKSQRMLIEQSRRCQLPETIATLSAMGMPVPEVSRIFLPGYLFYPFTDRLKAPDTSDPGHLRGRWLYLEEAHRKVDATAHWVVLRKPHWLGPWSQADAPDPEAVAAALDEIKVSGTPRLFAAMIYDDGPGRWREAERVFVVPPDWPGPR